MSKEPDTIHRLELTGLVALQEFRVGDDSCQGVGELLINSPDLYLISFGKRSFVRTTMLCIASAYLRLQNDPSPSSSSFKTGDSSSNSLFVIGDDSFPSASFIIEGWY